MPPAAKPAKKAAAPRTSPPGTPTARAPVLPIGPTVGLEDMVHLAELTEQSLLANLRIRYEADLIYVGSRPKKTKPEPPLVGSPTLVWRDRRGRRRTWARSWCR